jgi:hypothetical protein
MADYKRWCVPYGQDLDGRTHDDWIKEFTKWVFGKQPPYPDRPGNPLFVHGDMENNNQPRKMQVKIYRNDPIIVHVIGANFVKGDKDREGNILNSDQEIKAACNVEEHDDEPGKVMLKEARDKEFQDLSSCVEQLRPEVFEFETDGSNSDLKKWDVPMPEGPQRGAWACQLLLLKIPEQGEYVLNFNAKGVPPFESSAEYKIDVK